jgi:hypothetical protein
MHISAFIFLMLCVTATSNARADFAAALTGITVSAPGGPGNGLAQLDITMIVLATESGQADITITTDSLPEWFPSGSPAAVDTTLHIEAFDSGGVPPAADFQGIT